MSAKRKDEPGPEEQQELLREERSEGRDDLRALVDPDTEDAEESDGELTLDEVLDLDQTELDELGLTLDDPHQPDSE